MRCDGRCASIRVPGPGQRLPRPQPSARNTAGVATGTRGLTSTAKRGGKRKAGPSSSPAPRIMRARGSRQTGTSAPVRRAASAWPDRRGEGR